MPEVTVTPIIESPTVTSTTPSPVIPSPTETPSPTYTPTPTETPTPTHTPTPIPPPEPVPPPSPTLPPITLLWPIDNAYVGSQTELAWNWPASLPPDAAFSIRWGVASEGPPPSRVWCTEVLHPGAELCPDHKWTISFQDCENPEEHTVAWNVAVVIPDWESGNSYKQVLVQSETQYFRAQTTINDCPP
jgi:hypothetical protein